MHRIPVDRADVRMIDPDRVCTAIGALDDEAGVRVWAQRFALLGDRTRLRLLLCIKSAGPISVSDLTAAAGLNADTVSQTLRFLRANQTVTTQREGRVVRYELADPIISELLDDVGLGVTPASAGHC
jgi:DNA-binding transcriptional ArsR family regulator